MLLEACFDALGEIETAFSSARGRRSDKVAAFLTTYVGHVVQHPELLRLDGLSYGVLEKNLAPNKLREFKAAFAARLTKTARVIEQVLRLPQGTGIRLLMRSFAFTRGLWQAAPAAGKPAGIGSDAAVAVLHPSFETELMEALAEYWRGALIS